MVERVAQMRFRRPSRKKLYGIELTEEHDGRICIKLPSATGEAVPIPVQSVSGKPIHKLTYDKAVDMIRKTRCGVTIGVSIGRINTESYGTFAN